MLAVRGCGGFCTLLVNIRLIVCRLRLLLYQLLQYGHPLTDHVCQFSWRLQFILILRRVHCGEYSHFFADRIHVVVVIVSVFQYNLAVGDTDFRSSCLLLRPLCVHKDYGRA